MDMSALSNEQNEERVSSVVTTITESTKDNSNEQGVEIVSAYRAMENVKDSLSPEMNALAQDSKYVYSAMMHDRLQGKTLEEIVAILHINTDEPASLDSIIKANFISQADKLQLQGALSNYPYLHDVTNCSLYDEVYKNVALHQSLIDNTCIITKIAGKLSVVIGSTSGFEYVTKNLQNTFCPIKQFFNQHEQDPIYFTAYPDHINAILNREYTYEGSQVFDLSSHQQLFSFFEKVAKQFVYNVRFRVNLRNLLLENVSDIRSNVAMTTASEVFDEEQNICFTLNSMVDVSEIARGHGKPYVYLRSNNKNGIAYRAKRIQLPNQKSILEFELFPLIEDNFVNAPSKCEETNITKALKAFEDAVNRNKPIIFCVGSSIDSTTLHLAIVRQALINQMPVSFVLNQENTSYHGDSLFSLPINQKAMQDVTAFGDAVVLFGQARTIEQLETIGQFTTNLIPVVAITTATQQQLPTELVPFVHSL